VPGAARDAHAVVVLVDSGRPPSEAGVHVGEVGQPPAQHLLGAVLGQAFVGLEVVGLHELARRRRVPELAHQVLVGGHLPDGVVLRHRARGAELVGQAPEPEVLHGALGQPLPLGDARELCALLDDGTRDAPQPEIQGEADAHGAAAHDDDLVPVVHVRPCCWHND
jgi:hypothetical protein